MDNQLAKKPVVGSLAQVANQTGHAIAETFISADVIVIVDTSSSMASHDNSELSRYERACDELAKIQASMPGKIAVISFSDDVIFCPSGIPWNYSSGTDLAKALKFCRVADVPDMKFILISDGEPNDERSALDEAAKYKNPISTIYIGPAGGYGEKFLAKLAQKTAGKSAVDFSAHQLETTMKGLLSDGKL